MANISAIQSNVTQKTDARQLNASLFLIIGGLLQALYFIVFVTHGITTDGADVATANIWFNSLMGVGFVGSVLSYNTGLLILSRRYWSQGKIAFSISTAIFVLSLSLVVVGTVAAPLMDVRYGMFAGFGQITKLLAVTIFAIGALRSQVLPRYLGIFLLILGTVTFPAIVAFGTPLGLPIYITSELPFFVEGMMWIFFASRLPRKQ